MTSSQLVEAPPADLWGLWSPCLEEKSFVSGITRFQTQKWTRNGEKMSFLSSGPNKNISIVTQNCQVRTGRLACVACDTLGDSGPVQVRQEASHLAVPMRMVSSSGIPAPLSLSEANAC